MKFIDLIDTTIENLYNLDSNKSNKSELIKKKEK